MALITEPGQELVVDTGWDGLWEEMTVSLP
jgi:hypothetical protein